MTDGIVIHSTLAEGLLHQRLSLQAHTVLYKQKNCSTTIYPYRLIQYSTNRRTAPPPSIPTGPYSTVQTEGLLHHWLSLQAHTVLYKQKDCSTTGCPYRPIQYCTNRRTATPPAVPTGPYSTVQTEGLLYHRLSLQAHTVLTPVPICSDSTVQTEWLLYHYLSREFYRLRQYCTSRMTVPQVCPWEAFRLRQYCTSRMTVPPVCPREAFRFRQYYSTMGTHVTLAYSTLYCCLLATLANSRQYIIIHTYLYTRYPK